MDRGRGFRRRGGIHQQGKNHGDKRRVHRGKTGGGGWSGVLGAPIIHFWPAAAQVARRIDRPMREPSRPHRHGRRGFLCNGCKEWHPQGIMHCGLV
jgi:hypothetical protein